MIIKSMFGGRGITIDSHVACQLCGKEKVLAYAKVKETIKYQKVKTDYDFIIGKCIGCGFAFVLNPLPKEATDAIYEELLYDSFADNRPVKKNVFYDAHFLNPDQVQQKKANHEKILGLIQKHLNKEVKENKPKLLEVGCAYGQFLDMAGAAGFDGYGIELSKECVRYCHENGLKNVFCGAAEQEYGFQGNYFDVIVMEQVIEHLHDPVGAVKKFSALLNNGGLVYIECPIFKNNDVPLDQIHPIEHINYFSQGNLDSLMINTGMLRKLGNNLFLKAR